MSRVFSHRRTWRPDGSLASAGEVVIAQLDKSSASEALFVATMDFGHGQFAQASHRRAVVTEVRPVELVEQRSVIDRVAGKQDASALLPQADATRGMTREVDHLERPVAQVDHVAFVQELGGRRPLQFEAVRRHAAGGHGIDHQLGDVIAGISVRSEDGLAVAIGGNAVRTNGLQVLRLGRVDRAFVEFVHAPHVITVRVSGDREERIDGLGLDERTQRLDAERCVDDQIAVTAAHMPDVAAQQWVHMRF